MYRRFGRELFINVQYENCRNEDKHNSAQYEAKIALDLNSMFPVRLSEFDTVGEADVSLPVY